MVVESLRMATESGILIKNWETLWLQAQCVTATKRKNVMNGMRLRYSSCFVWNKKENHRRKPFVILNLTSLTGIFCVLLVGCSFQESHHPTLKCHVEGRDPSGNLQLLLSL